MRRFEGRVAIVTGAASGIGAAVAARLAGEGATTVFVDIDDSTASAKAHEAGGSTLALRCDIAEPDSVAALHREVLL